MSEVCSGEQTFAQLRTGFSSTQTFRWALTASLDSCAEIKIECPFSGVTKSVRVWRKVPESDARSVQIALSFSTVSEIHASHRLSTDDVNIQQRTRHEALNTNSLKPEVINIYNLC